MASKNTTLIVLILYSLLHQTSSHPPPSTAAASLQESVCQKSNDYKSCIRTVKSDPKLARAKDINALASAAMAKAKRQTVALSKLFAEMQIKHRDPKMRAAYKACAFDFTDAMMFFNPDGLWDMTKSLDVHSALDDFENCETMLTANGGGGAGKELRKMDPALKKWRHLYSIANGAILYAEAQPGRHREEDGGGPGDYP
ncbi:hypothetical protein LINGRAHAP2_LOCUS3654 [Linum grandiflorum]